VSVDLVPLALLMAVATYPARALPLLAPGIDRLPRLAVDYLRLVGPGMLAALAAVNVAIVTTDYGPTLHIGIEWVAVLVAVAITAWRRSLVVALVAASFIVAVARATGWAT
jgi:branched-subunit amino acid transport protein